MLSSPHHLLESPTMKTKAGMDPADSNSCVVCEKATVEYSCKLCKGYFYCSKGCCKADTKNHKRTCSAFACFLKTTERASSEPPSPQLRPLIRRHFSYLASKHQKRDEEKAEGRARTQSVLSQSQGAAKGGRIDKLSAARAAIYQAAATVAANLEGHKQASARVAAARADVARAAADAVRLTPKRYGDSDYWEERHAESGKNDETYEWYTGYPDKALRKAFPNSFRGKKTLVVGCGNSELSEKMCRDGFRDVLSIDTSKSAIEQMSKRAHRFNTPQTKCRYEVMDARKLDNLGSETFGGVVDKGTIDAVLSGGLEPARRICQEAMRILEPGGRFLVISNTPGEKLLETLLDMCGPGSTVDDWPLVVPVSEGGSAEGPCVHAYIVRKSPGPARVGGGAAIPGGVDNDAQGLERPEENGGCDATAVEEDGGPAGSPGGGDRGTPGSGGGGAPPSDRHVSELDSTPEERQPKLGVDGGAGGGGREGEAMGQCPPSAENERGVMDSCEPLRQKTAVEEERAGSQEAQRLKDSPTSTTRENNAVEAGGGRGEAARSERLPPKEARSVGAVRPVPTRRSPQEQLQYLNEIAIEQQGTLLSTIAILEAAKAQSLRGGEAIEPSPRAAREDRPPSSLPWGARENFSENLVCATYELRLEEEITPSKLSVEVGPSRLKASYQPRPGERKVLLDRELREKVTSESTWSIEDRRLLSFDLCKRVGNWWRVPFKNDAPGQSASSPPGSVGRRGARDPADIIDARLREQPPALSGCEALKPVPVPPAVPRKHERSPKVELSTGNNFKAPERFLVEDHTGIKKLQLYLFKPRGFKVTSSMVTRAGPDVCEVRFVCRDQSGQGRPEARFLQKVSLGRPGFDPDQASFSGETPDDLCIVGVPYSVDDPAGPQCEGLAGTADLDDEGVPRVSRLRCRFCGHLITPAGRGLAVRAMPTGRWDECIEDMICFDGPQAVPMLSGDVNFARPGRCLMAQVEVLLHPRDVVPGAVALNEDLAAEEASRVGTGDPGSFPAETEDGLQWRSIECARCDLPLGRPAAPRAGLDGCGLADGASKEDRGLLLLKHCLLGDDLDADDGDGEEAIDEEKQREAASGGGGGGTSTAGEGTKSGQTKRRKAAGSSAGRPLPVVFEHRTAIKWLMGEMSFFNERDGCARFIVSAKGRSPSAPGGALSLVLAKMNSLVSIDGGSKPGRAHRVAFREESREEAERADEEETWEEEKESKPSPSLPPPVGKAVAGGGESVGKTAAKVPARVLEVSYGEYAAVRERLRRAAWAGVPWCKLDPRGYSYSYLF